MKERTLTTITEVFSTGTDIATAKSGTIEVRGTETVTLYADVTGASTNKITVTLETSADNAIFFPLSTMTDSSGTTTVNNRKFEFTMNATANKFQIPINVQDNYLKITMVGTGTNTATLTALQIS